MAQALCGLIAAVGFVWPFVLLGGSSKRRPDGWAQLRAQRMTSQALLAVGSTPIVTELLRIPAWRRLSREIASHVPREVIDLSLEEACAAALLVSVAAVCGCTLIAWSPIGTFVGLAAVLAGVPLWASNRERADASALIAAMPGVFRTLATALSSGQTLSQAIEYVGAHEDGVAGIAFSRMGLRMRCGESCEEALDHLGEELHAPGIDLLTTALLISQRTGSPLKDLFQSSAVLVERQGEVERELAVKTAQVRLSVRIVCLLPALLVAALSLLSPDFRGGLATIPGIVSIAVALTMDGIALLIIRRLLKDVV